MIAVDWGTSSFRAYRLDEHGVVVGERTSDAGILNVANGAFAETLEAALGDWTRDGPIVMSGMIGSRQGWREVPYLDCPAGLAEIAGGMDLVRWGDGYEAWIVPGLVCRDETSTPDVMRGEETQILGALQQLPSEGKATVCLPGTHSKWTTVEDGRILSFTTAMTGEVFAVLRRHSILGRLMTSELEPAGLEPGDDSWFDAGIRRAGQAGGLLHHLFGVRSRGLFDEIPSHGLAPYLSGILIGHEIAEFAPRDGTTYLIGTPHLTMLYRRALSSLGCASRELEPSAVARGLYRLAAA